MAMAGEARRGVWRAGASRRTPVLAPHPHPRSTATVRLIEDWPSSAPIAGSRAVKMTRSLTVARVMCGPIWELSVD